jgi:hypothetical protein
MNGIEYPSGSHHPLDPYGVLGTSGVVMEHLGASDALETKGGSRGNQYKSIQTGSNTGLHSG